MLAWVPSSLTDSGHFWYTKPIQSSKPFRVAQATRVYCAHSREPESHGNREHTMTRIMQTGKGKSLRIQNPHQGAPGAPAARIRELPPSFPPLPWLGHPQGLCLPLCVCPISSASRGFLVLPSMYPFHSSALESYNSDLLLVPQGLSFLWPSKHLITICFCLHLPRQIPGK